MEKSMHFDAALPPASLSQVPALARAAEAAGFSAVWTAETQHNPFLPLPLVAEHTTRLRFGTRIPIFIAGVNTGLARLCGEVCDGFHVHPLHTPAYVREVVRPAIAAGAAKARRALSEIEVAGSVFVVTSEKEREFVRQQISFYASTPSYRPVLEHHGWGGVGEQLSALAARGQWDAMPALVTDEMLNTVAIVAPLTQLAAPLKERYAGLIDRLTLYSPFVPGQKDAEWKGLAGQMQASTC